MLRVISKIRFGFCEVPKVKKPRRRRTGKIDWHQRNLKEQQLKQQQYITYMYRKDEDPSFLVLDRFQHLDLKQDKESAAKVRVDDDKILKALEENEQLIQDPNSLDEAKDFEIELQKQIILALSESIPNYEPKNFKHLYEQLFAEKIYDFFSVEEFTLLLENPLFAEDVKGFPDQFFIQNQFVVYSSKFVGIAVEQALEGDDTLLQKLQFADQIDQGNYFEDPKEFHKILQNFNGNYDQLRVIFFLNYSQFEKPLLDSTTFIYLIKLIAKIEWGGVQYSKKQQQAINDLLFIKLQVQNSVPMMSFLADIFCTNLKYDHAVLSVVNTILLLERVYYGKNLTDLLHVYQKTFGTKRFNYYFRDILPKVLDTFSNKTYYSNYTLQLEIYEKQNKFFIQRLGFLDSTFFASSKLRIFQSVIEYQNNGFNLLSLTIDIERVKQLELFQNQIIDGNTNQALKQLKKSYPHYQNESDISNKVISELYQNLEFKLELEKAQQATLVDRNQEYIDKYVKFLDEKAEKWKEDQKARWEARNAQQQALQGQKEESAKQGGEQSGEGLSTPQAGFSTMKPRFGFSTLTPPIEIKEGNKGFLDYLRSAKNIDTEVNERENQKIEDQIKEIDQIIKQDQINIKQSRQDHSSQAHKLHFKPVSFEQKKTQKEVKIAQEIKEEISEQIRYQDSKNQIKKQKIIVEQILLDPNFTDQAKSEIAYAFDTDINQAQQTQRLLTQLKDLKNSQYSPYYVKALINQFGQSAGSQFSNLFFYQNNEFKHQEVDLKVNYETQYGFVEKDLSQYLQGNLIQASIGQAGYDSLLQRQQQDFKRSQFKKILSHFALYEKQLYDSTLELICKIISDQKIPQTLTEYIYLFSKNDVKLSKDQIILVSDTLMHFKDYEVEVCQLLLNVYKKNDFVIVYSDFQNFVKKSIERAKRDLYMSFYENIKDAMLSRKQKVESQQQIDASEKQYDQNWIQTKKELFGEFVRNMVSDLGKYNQEDCRLIMNDARLIRYNFKEIDYVHWIQANEKHPEEVEKIYNDYLKRYPEGTEFAKVLIAMQRAFQHNPNQTKILFQDIVKQHIFSKKYQFNDQQITELTNSFRRMKEFSSFSHFLMMLMDQGYKINQTHKTLFYSVMNSADDDQQKSTIKGIVDQMILDDKDKDKTKKQTNYTTSEVFEFIPPTKDELVIYQPIARNKENFIGRLSFTKYTFMLEEGEENEIQVGKPAKIGKPSNKKK